MKAFLRLFFAGVVVVFLFYTNPAQDEFEAYVQERIEDRLSEETADNRLGRLLTDMGSTIVGSLAARVTDRTNFGLFSIYSVDVGGDGDPDEAWKFLGIGGTFVELSAPNQE